MLSLQKLMLLVKTYAQAAQNDFQLWRTFTPWTLSHIIESSTHRHERYSNSQLYRW